MSDRFAIAQETHYDGRRLRCYTRRPPNVDRMLRGVVAARPRAVALRLDNTLVSYGELDAIIDRVAANLAQSGVARGERVALALGNRLEFAYALLGCVRLGAIAVPLNIRMRRPELEFALNQCGAAALIHEADLAGQVPAPAAVPTVRRVYACGGAVPGAQPFAQLTAPVAPPPAVLADEEAVCHLLYTSGTTGQPKGAMLTHLGILHSALHFERHSELRAGDVTILAVPASHVTGLVAQLYTQLQVGGTVVLMREFRAREWLELAQAVKCTNTIMVPAMYNLMLLDPEFDRFDLTAWRYGAYGGAPMPEATIAGMAARLPHLALANGYGATETTSPMTLMPVGLTEGHADSVGKVLQCCDTKVVDDAGNEVPPGTVGELWHAGPNVVPGYWDNPAANAENFSGSHWKSGDLGSIDAEGFVRVVDRKKDMINRAGFKVYSAEVENVLAHHPEVLECAIVGRPDPVLGERVQLFVVPKTAAPSLDSIRAFAGERLSDYKVPDHLTVLAAPLPRNPNGKVVKGELRKIVEAELREELR